MSALPPQQTRTMRQTVRDAAQPVSALGARWSEIHDQAAEIAGHAGLARERDVLDAQDFTALVEAASPFQHDLAWQGVEDIHAILAPGLAALRTITTRGQDACVPALALWREFYAARRAVLTALHHEAPRKAA